MLFWNVCLGAHFSNPSWTLVLGSQHLDFPLLFPKVVTFIWSVISGISGGDLLCSRAVPETERYWGVAGRPKPWKSPLSIVSFTASSVITRGLFFLQCCVNHFIELPSLHPSLPQRIASDMLNFALSSIITLVNFQQECLACHPLSNSLMIKTEALAVHMPATDRTSVSILCPLSPQIVLITSAFA